MSEMGNWLAKLGNVDGRPAITAPVSGEPDIGGPPVAPAPGEPDIGAPPVAPIAPGAAGGLKPLEIFLHMLYKNGGTLTPEMYSYYGGDEILKALQVYDPAARWTDVDVGGGEEGRSAVGKRLDFDQTKLPGAGPGGVMDNGFGFAPVGQGQDLINEQMYYDDPIYGRMTPSQNIRHSKPAWWEYAAPAVISMFAPMAGAALMGAGIGAGSTAAVTGAAAGLGAEGIALGGAPTWWSQALSKAPQLGRAASNYWGGGTPPPTGKPSPDAPLPTRGPDMYGYDPNAFNSAGNAAKPGGGDSQLVANQFSDDPYGFSNRGF